ncbi:hypothetical protein ACEPPN_015186 [Leptodophora sp. 'Broadleaf-Isolate-01']
MTESVCTAITLGDPNLGDTTITHGTIGRAAGLVRKKRKRIFPEREEEAGVRKKPRQDSDVLVQQTMPEGLVDMQRLDKSCFDKDWFVISTDSVALSVSDLTRALKIQKNHPVLVEAIQKLKNILSGSRDPATVSDSDVAEALKIQKNYQVLVEATQQLEKMLPGSGDARIIASKILSRLSSAEMVLLSCTTAIGREDFSTLSDRQGSGFWFDEKEEEAFCRKFNDSMSGYWDRGEIFNKWEALYKVLAKSIHMWETKVCVKDWEADRDIGDSDYSTILQKVKHQHSHRTYEEEKKAIRDRSGSVVQWDLAVYGELVSTGQAHLEYN